MISSTTPLFYIGAFKLSTINHSKRTKIKSSTPGRNGNSEDVSSVIPAGSWTGRRCFILGGGPSLIGFDFKTVMGELTIGINKSFASFPVLVNYSMDPSFYDRVSFPNNDPVNPHIHRLWSEYQGIKVFLKKGSKRNYNNVYTVNQLKQKAISTNPAAGIYGGANSGLGAIMLAIAFGCREIYLLGYDMSVDMKHGRTHCHEGYRSTNNRNMKDVLLSHQRKLSKFGNEFNELAPSIKEFGVNVYNLNPNSGITCFPKQSIKEVMSK